MSRFDLPDGHESAFGNVGLSLLDKTGKERHAGDFNDVLKGEVGFGVRSKAIFVLASAWFETVG